MLQRRGPEPLGPATGGPPAAGPGGKGAARAGPAARWRRSAGAFVAMGALVLVGLLQGGGLSGGFDPHRLVLSHGLERDRDRYEASPRGSRGKAGAAAAADAGGVPSTAGGGTDPAPELAAAVPGAGPDPLGEALQAMAFERCKQPWHELTKREVKRFFLRQPQCQFLTECGAALPSSKGAHVTKIHSSFIKRFSEDVRYMHMVNTAKLKDGALLAVWQESAGVIPRQDAAYNWTDINLVGEGLDAQHLMISLSADGEGRVWTKPVPLPVRQAAALWSPVLHVNDDNSVVLFYSESEVCRKASLCEPCTEGDRRKCPAATAGTPICEYLTPQWVPGGSIKMLRSVGDVRNNRWEEGGTVLGQEAEGYIPKVISDKLLVLRDGTWVLPYWREQAALTVKDGTCRRDMAAPPWPEECLAHRQQVCVSGAEEFAGVLRSGDGGRTWTTHGRIAVPHTPLIEGTVAQRGDGSLLMLFRSQAGCLYRSTSADGGLNWAAPATLNLPNPNSKVHLTALESGHLLLAFNNHRSPGGYGGLPRACKGCRTKLHLALSKDGVEWQHVYSVEDDAALPWFRAHYPSLLQLAGNRVLLAYTRFFIRSQLGLSRDQGVIAHVVELDRALLA